MRLDRWTDTSSSQARPGRRYLNDNEKSRSSNLRSYREFLSVGGGVEEKKKSAAAAFSRLASRVPGNRRETPTFVQARVQLEAASSSESAFYQRNGSRARESL